MCLGSVYFEKRLRHQVHVVILPKLPCIPFIIINKGLGIGFPVSLVHCFYIVRVLLSLIIRVSHYCSLLPRIIASCCLWTDWLTKCATLRAITTTYLRVKYCLCDSWGVQYQGRSFKRSHFDIFLFFILKLLVIIRFDKIYINCYALPLMFNTNS